MQNRRAPLRPAVQMARDAGDPIPPSTNAPDENAGTISASGANCSAPRCTSWNWTCCAGGERSPLETPLPPAPYYVTLARTDHRPLVDVWPIQLEARLPVLPVPLSAPDPDVPLDLGAVVQAVYERGGYTTRIDYRQPVPPPPLEPEQQAWVEQLLRSLSD